MFELDRFIEECRAAVREDPSHKAAREIVARAVSDPAGVLAGLFGVGGGILFVPTLTLGLGLTQIHAEASSLLAILPTVAAGTWRQWRYGNVRWRAAATIGIAAVGGVEAGVALAESLSEDVLRRLFGALTILIALQIVWRLRGR